MIRIAIVEDDQQYADTLMEYLERFQQENQYQFQIRRYHDGAEIVEALPLEADILLMDIEMEVMDGMTAAEKIRLVDKDVVIIFITNMMHYAMKGYAVEALDYVLKPINYFSFSQRISRANDIGVKTSEKMAEFQAVLWPHHGVFASGVTLDETYGLVEVIEKAAMIFSQVGAQGGVIKQEITDQELQEIAAFFGMTPHEGFLDL